MIAVSPVAGVMRFSPFGLPPGRCRLMGYFRLTWESVKEISHSVIFQEKVPGGEGGGAMV